MVLTGPLPFPRQPCWCWFLRDVLDLDVAISTDTDREARIAETFVDWGLERGKHLVRNLEFEPPRQSIEK